MFKNKHFINTPNLIHNPKYFCLFYFQLHVFSNTRILNVLPFNSNDSLANVLTKLLLNCKKNAEIILKACGVTTLKVKTWKTFRCCEVKLLQFILFRPAIRVYIEIYIKIWKVEDIRKEFDGIFYVFI